MHQLTLTRHYNQPAHKTWEVFKNFNEVPIPGARVTLLEGENNKVGCVRKITYENGASIVERLDAFVDSGPQYVFSYRIPEPMNGLQQCVGTWIVHPVGKDGNRSAIQMFLTWEPDNEESNEIFESVCIDLLQNGFLAAADAKQNQ